MVCVSLKERCREAYGSCTKDTTDGPKDIIGVLIRHERDDQIGDSQTEETPSKDRFRRVKVGNPPPQQEETGESDRVSGDDPARALIRLPSSQLGNIPQVSRRG